MPKLDELTPNERHYLRDMLLDLMRGLEATIDQNFRQEMTSVSLKKVPGC